MGINGATALLLVGPDVNLDVVSSVGLHIPFPLQSQP